MNTAVCSQNMQLVYTQCIYLILTPTTCTLGQYIRNARQNGKPATLMKIINKAAFLPLFSGFLNMNRTNDPTTDPTPSIIMINKIIIKFRHA